MSKKITKEFDGEKHVLIWVNVRDFYGSESVDSGDFLYATNENIKDVKEKEVETE